MAKVFETNFRKGSLKNSISGELLTNNSSKLKKTQNGMMAEFRTDANMRFNSDVFNFGLSDFSFSFYFRTDNSSSDAVARCLFSKGWMSGAYDVWLPFIGNIMVGFGGTPFDSGVAVDDNITHYVSLVFDRDADLKFYIDGVLVNSGDISAHETDNIWSSYNFTIGSYVTATEGRFDGYIGDIKAYNHALTEEEVLRDYKEMSSIVSLASPIRNFIYTESTPLTEQIYLYEDFRYAKADGSSVVPLGWGLGSGAFKITEEYGGKYVKCTSGGVLYTQSKQAYGTWEFKMIAGPDNRMYFINNNTLGYINGIGYYFITGNYDNIAIVRAMPGSVRVLLKSVPVTTRGVEYEVKIERTILGDFTLYIKGGEWGEEYTSDFDLVTGSNPFNSTTIGTSEYITLEGISSTGIFSNIKLIRE